MNFKLTVVGFVVALLLVATAYSQERAMGVRQKPDAVFSQPVEALVPELAGATATDENGRVGAELVFWGYRLGDGRTAFLFACAPSESRELRRARAVDLRGRDQRDPQLHGRWHGHAAQVHQRRRGGAGRAAPGLQGQRKGGPAGRGARELRLRPAGSALAGAARVTIHLLRRGRSWRSISK